jgi:hypothetical protein
MQIHNVIGVADAFDEVIDEVGADGAAGDVFAEFEGKRIGVFF